MSLLLQNTCLNDGDINLVQFLQEIASEQVFEVTYVDIEEKSISGRLILILHTYRFDIILHLFSLTSIYVFGITEGIVDYFSGDIRGEKNMSIS